MGPCTSCLDESEGRKEMAPITLLIDVANHLHADWHASGDRAAGIFLRRAGRMRELLSSTSIAMAFECEGPTFRHELIDGYKADRPETPAELIEQFAKVRDACIQNAWPVLQVAQCEADDVIATAARIALEFGHRVVISSSDKDCRQLLVQGRVSILRKVGQTARDSQWITAETLEADTGVRADQWIDYQCLVGDSTDSIVGAKGIGPKTAVAILQTVGSLQAAFANPWKLPVTDRQRNNLTAFRKRVELVRQLVTLRTDADLEWVP